MCPPPAGLAPHTRHVPPTYPSPPNPHQTHHNHDHRRALQLVFARSVPAAKVVDALSSISGVKEAVLADFSATLLKAIGGSIGKGESVTLAWTGDDKLALQVGCGLGLVLCGGCGFVGLT